MHGSREYALYTVATSGGSPKLIVTYPDFSGGIAWTTDDKRILLSQEAVNADELDEVVVASGSIRRLPFAHDGSWPAISPKGQRLVYAAMSVNINIWRRDLAHPESPAVKLISSTREQDLAQYSPDGKHIAFQSTRAGVMDIWMSDADGASPVQVSKFDDATGAPQWSPDSTKLAFDLRRPGHGDVYIVDVRDLVLRKLKTDKPDVFMPSWSHDGKWIYFTSDVGIGQKIYRCPAVGGSATALSQPPGTNPRESLDGTEVYFLTRIVRSSIKQAFLNRPGEDFLLQGLPAVRNWTLWTQVQGGIYFVPADAPRSLRYFDFASKRIRDVFEIQRDFNLGLSVSPDGRWMLYSQLDEGNSDIMLVEHFR
jgi:Tol biopolymer transport system component